MIKGSTHQEDITILNIYTANKTFKVHEAETDLTGETDISTNQCGIPSS